MKSIRMSAVADKDEKLIGCSPSCEDDLDHSRGGDYLLNSSGPHKRANSTSLYQWEGDGVSNSMGYFSMQLATEVNGPGGQLNSGSFQPVILWSIVIGSFLSSLIYFAEWTIGSERIQATSVGTLSVGPHASFLLIVISVGFGCLLSNRIKTARSIAVFLGLFLVIEALYAGGLLPVFLESVFTTVLPNIPHTDKLISVNGLVAISALAAALFILTTQSSLPLTIACSFLLALTGIGIALLGLYGHMYRIEGAYAWGKELQFAPSTATLIVFLGTAIAVRAWRRFDSSRRDLVDSLRGIQAVSAGVLLLTIILSSAIAIIPFYESLLAAPVGVGNAGESHLVHLTLAKVVFGVAVIGIVSSAIIFGLISRLSSLVVVREDRLRASLYKLREELELRTRLQTETERALQSTEVLIKEVHHRVRNNLQMILSLVSLQLRRTKNQEAVKNLEGLSNRVRSIALLHHMLYQTQNLGAIALDEYLHDLFGQISQSIETDPQVAFRTSGCKIEIDIAQALPLGLIFTELMSNSLQYAFPKPDAKAEASHIVISLVQEEAGDLTFTYRDSGVGLPVSFEIEREDSFGSRLLSVLTRQLKGTITAHPGDGAHYHLTIPGHLTISGSQLQQENKNHEKAPNLYR